MRRCVISPVIVQKDIKKNSTTCIYSDILYLFNVSVNRIIHFSQYYEKLHVAECLLLCQV